MPQICEFFGVDVYRYYNDHRPSHFQAMYTEHEALFAIDTLEIEEFKVRLEFTDNTTKEMALKPYLHGPIFEPIR